MSRVALISGGGRGIGRAVAVALAREGLACAVMARTSSQLAETVREVEAAGGQALAIPGDVRREVDAEHAVSTCVQRLGGLDVLVNNAGIFRTAPLLETRAELWQEVLATNLTGAFLLTRPAVRHMLGVGGGMIVNVSSVAGRKGFPGSTAYCASKFGLLGFSEALREELRPHGIRVVSLLPGQVDTSAWNECGLDLKALGIERRAMMKPAAVAAAVALSVRDPGGAVAEEIVLRPPAGD